MCILCICAITRNIERIKEYFVSISVSVSGARLERGSCSYLEKSVEASLGESLGTR